MKQSSKITAVAVILLLIISLGLNIVFAVGSGAEPGSERDPIVSKSYVDAAVVQLTAKVQLLLEQNDLLKNQNVQLTARITAQEQALKAVQEAMKSGAAAGAGKTGSAGGTVAKPAASIGKGIVNIEVLNIRSQPNTISSILAKVAKNETLTLVSKSGDWYKVTTSKGTSGYVMAKFVTVKK